MCGLLTQAYNSGVPFSIVRYGAPSDSLTPAGNVAVTLAGETSRGAQLGRAQVPHSPTCCPPPPARQVQQPNGRSAARPSSTSCMCLCMLPVQRAEKARCCSAGSKGGGRGAAADTARHECGAGGGRLRSRRSHAAWIRGRRGQLPRRLMPPCRQACAASVHCQADCRRKHTNAGVSSNPADIHAESACNPIPFVPSPQALPQAEVEVEEAEEAEEAPAPAPARPSPARRTVQQVSCLVDVHMAHSHPNMSPESQGLKHHVLQHAKEVPCPIR